MSDPTPTDPQADKSSEHRWRMRSDWDNLIDELIEEGRRQGAFDNLPGAGKPLNLRRNRYAPETELAHDLLRQNDLVGVYSINPNPFPLDVYRVAHDLDWFISPGRFGGGFMDASGQPNGRLQPISTADHPLEYRKNRFPNSECEFIEKGHGSNDLYKFDDGQ